MKKYDLSIIGAYVAIIIAVLIYMRLVYNDVSDMQTEAMKTFSMEVDSMVIQNYDKKLRVNRTDVAIALNNSNWDIRTQIYQNGLKFLKIEDKVLRVGSTDNEPISGIAFLTLYVDLDMPVTVINSPNVTFETMMDTTTTTHYDKNVNEIEDPSKAKK